MDEKAKYRPDFTGYWRQVKNENFDAFLKEVNVPWVLRKLLIKYGSKSIDLIHQTGPVLRVTTVNAKASWSRTLQEGKALQQRDAEGNVVKSTAWWDGDVHKSRMEGGKHGSIESWRYMDGGLMVVKTVLTSGKHGRLVTMHWYLEALDVPGTGGPLQVAQDQKRVERASNKDTVYAQKLLQNMAKWETPADRYLAASDKERKEHVLPFRSGSPLSSSLSPFSSSARASNSELPETANLQPSLSSSSTALGRPPRVMSSGTLSDTERSEAGVPSARHSRKPSDERADSDAAEPPAPHANGHSDRASCNASSMTGPKLQPIHGTLHRRTGSAFSDPGGAEKSLGSGSRVRHMPESLEAQLSYKLAEYSENRSITSVLPVDNPLATDEPELLEMSPEEAEGTQLKLAEAEREAGRVALKRQEYAAGHTIGCCTCVFHNYIIPTYLRVWDL